MCDIMIRKAFLEDAEALLSYLQKIGRQTDNLSFGAEGLPVSLEQEREPWKRMVPQCSVPGRAVNLLEMEVSADFPDGCSTGQI